MKYSSNNFWTNILAPLGMALVLLNTSVGMWGNYFTGGNSNMSNMVIIVGVLLTVDWKNLSRIRFPIWNSYFNIMLIFQVVCILYFLQSNYDIKSLYFHFSFLAFMVALSSREKVNEKLIVRWLFFISSFTTLLGIWAIYTGQLTRAFYVGDNYISSVTEAQEDILELFTVASSGVYCFLSGLILLKENKTGIKIVTVVFMTLAVFLIALCTKRNPFVKCAFCVLIFIHNQYSLRKICDKRIVMRFIVITIIAFFILHLTGIGAEAISSMTDNVFAGINDMMTGANTDQTGSAHFRAIQRQQGFDHIAKMNVEEIFLGTGYMWKWLDVPLVQVMCDMGVLGLCFFFYLIIYKPLKAMWKCKYSSSLVLVGLMVSSHLSQCMNSGHPYQFAYYFGPIFLFWALKYKSMSKYTQ